MATNYWLGTVTAAVARVVTIQVTGYDAATTYKLTVGDVTFSSVAAGSAILAAGALVTAWNASAHQYATPITASNGGTDTVTLTADTAGVPFVVTSSVTGGAGTIGAATIATAGKGRHDWATPENWSLGAVPVNDDHVIIKDSEADILWGLDQSSVTLNSLTIEKTFTGDLGLDRTVFTTSEDGATNVTTKTEYRQRYLKILVKTPDGTADGVKISRHTGPGNPVGSSRIMLDTSTTATIIEIFDSASAGENNRPAIKLLCASASTSIFVRSAPGGVGLAVDAPGETSTVGIVSISDTSSASKVYLGPGVTVTTIFQQGGDNLYQAAATITGLTVNGGSARTEGDFTITTATVNGGTLNSNHVKTGAACITTLAANGGTVDFQGNNRARTVTTTNLAVGAKIKADGSVMTFTNKFAQPSGKYTLAVS